MVIKRLMGPAKILTKIFFLVRIPRRKVRGREREGGRLGERGTEGGREGERGI